MKVTIKNENKSSEIKYPCLMVDKTGYEIVLFHEHRKGVLINGPSAGEYYQYWFMDLFTPFTGTVELSND